MDVLEEVFARLDVRDVISMDVVEEVLARLDVRDVLRYKSVCKSWYNLISSIYFVKAHLKHSYNSNRQYGYLRIRLDANFSKIPHDYEWCSFKTVGSFNGLVCICSNNGLFLVINPSTREVRNLPMMAYNDRRKLCWGFGYDSSTDDYKVVVGFNGSKHHIRFQVFSLKSTKWKIIGDDYYYLTYNTKTNDPICGFLHAGALHWFMYDTKKNKRVIFSFDLSLEKLKEIPQPDDPEYVCDNQNILGTFEERLCIFHDVHANPRQTWVMEMYDSWQLLPHDYEGHADYSKDYTIGALVFVKSLVSPYPCGKPNNKKNSKRNRRKNKACFNYRLSLKFYLMLYVILLDE
ncbi:F-box/kelch-repeat protein At3g06240-like [Rutidosis leptorrhynchoides]|uniref:F-box/kelch-repeat protein At3g06240-like n=1 Tax=Rutidosis leptorrhynchoides TaxID=125765 RepID=UPI003A9A026D